MKLDSQAGGTPSASESGAAPRDAAAAERRLRAAIGLAPGNAQPWRKLGDLLLAKGQRDEGGAAHLRALELSANEPQLRAAAADLAAGRLSEAYARLKPRLAAEPTNLALLRMMAEVATRTGHHLQAARMLTHALRIAPGFHVARQGLAEALYRAEPHEALAEVDVQLARQPSSRGFLTLRAALLDRAGRYQEALGVYEAMLATEAGDAAVWTASGHILKTLGRREEGVAAHRRSIALDPRRGESWWALADMKTGELGPDDVLRLEALLSNAKLPPAERAPMQFALGAAQERARDWPRAFQSYAEANALMRRSAHHDAGELPALLAASAATFTPTFFAERAGWGVREPDPIFVVGMPRSGSTLLEQMLAGHPAIDGTMELDVLPRLVREIDAGAARASAVPYPGATAALPRTEVERFARTFLAGIAPHRHGAAFVIDKRPENFAFVGLIRLLLPRAMIIDVRRDPLDCCLSLFRQHFARGRTYSYSLEDLGAAYRSYIDFMNLWDGVLPGAVLRVRYEALVANPRAELGRIFAAIGLPFHEDCLRFHENPRPVRTPSAEQVRRPLNSDGVGQWRNFAPWLAPLQQSLGPLGGAHLGSD